MADNDIIAMDLADAIIERPYAFDADGIRYFLYPPTLGKTVIIERHIAELGFDFEIASESPMIEALSVCMSNAEGVARIIALHTCKDKGELFDGELIEHRTKSIKNAASAEELASVLVLLLTRYGTSHFIEHLGLDKEKQDIERVRKCKKTKGSYTFGGKSIYGTVIDYACERYGWTMDYVVWGISYQNLQMLMADAIQSIYLTDDEQKNCHVAKNTDGKVINGDDPNSVAALEELLNN